MSDFTCTVRFILQINTINIVPEDKIIYCISHWNNTENGYSQTCWKYPFFPSITVRQLGHISQKICNNFHHDSAMISSAFTFSFMWIKASWIWYKISWRKIHSQQEILRIYLRIWINTYLFKIITSSKTSYNVPLVVPVANFLRPEKIIG